MKKNFIRIFLFLILFAALSQQLYTLYFVFLQDNFVDFTVYFNAAVTALAHGNVYSIQKTVVQAIPFNYPPTSLLFFLVFTLFPKTITAFVFLVSSIASLLVTVWLLTGMLFTKTRRLTAFLFLSSFFIQYFPTKFTLTLGQINLVILLLLTASFYFFRKNKDILSGFLLGIATLIKIFPCFLILFFIKEKKWKTIVSFIFTILIGLGLTLLLFTPALVSSYFGATSGNLFLHAGEVSYFDQSFNSFLLRLHFSSDIRLLLRVILTGISLLVFLKTKSKTLSYFGLIFSILIFLPSFAWFHHYVILIPLLIVLWTKTTHGREKIFLVLIYLVTSFHVRTPEAFPSSPIWLFSHPFIGACLLWLFAIKKTLSSGKLK